MTGAWMGGLLLAWLMGCGAGTPTGDVQVAAPAIAPFPEERLAAAWPLQYAKEADLAAVSGEGWTQLANRHDLAASVKAQAAAGGLPLARGHIEAAALFRQAALLEGNSLIETFATTPEPTDPVGVAHLLTVAYALNGKWAEARQWSAKLDGVDDPTQAWHGPWKTWLASGDTPAWPPDLSALPGALEAPAAGAWPEVGELPHYRLPEVGGTAVREMGDPGALVALALWHEAAAVAAAPDHAAALHAYVAPYRLPAEPMDAPSPAPMELMFASELLVPDDASFLADLRAKGLPAVEEWRDRSLLAELAIRSRGPSGKIDPLVAADQIGALRDAIVAGGATRAGGAMNWHRTFADIATVGATRNLALVADAEGDRETAGRLRIAAMERSTKETANPSGLMALAAWDAGNRYPMRAQEILHAHLSRFPALEVARYGLDVLALRVSRERPGETAGM